MSAPRDPREMTCTRCHEPAGVPGDLSHLPIEYVAELCSNWLCANCLDDDEAEDEGGAQ